MVKQPKTPSQIRNTSRWRNLSAYIRSKQPFCADPFNRHTATLADDVHHVIPIVKEPSLAYDKRNLVPLCRKCHAEVEAIESKYGETSFLFGAGVSKSLHDKQQNTVRPVQKKMQHFWGCGGLKLGVSCHDTGIKRDNAKGTIWCCRMKTFVSYYCGNCKEISSKVRDE